MMDYSSVKGNLNKIMGWEPMTADKTIQRLKELGDRDRTMMVNEKAGNVAICPACGEMTVTTNKPPCFCIVCGQRLEWGVET